MTERRRGRSFRFACLINMDDNLKWAGTIKVQRELTTGSENRTVLITSQDRSLFYQGPMDPALLKWFRQGEPKFYAHAELRGTLIHIQRKVAPEDW